MPKSADDTQAPSSSVVLVGLPLETSADTATRSTQRTEAIRPTVPSPARLERSWAMTPEFIIPATALPHHVAASDMALPPAAVITASVLRVGRS